MLRRVVVVPTSPLRTMPVSVTSMRNLPLGLAMTAAGAAAGTAATTLMAASATTASAPLRREIRLNTLLMLFPLCSVGHHRECRGNEADALDRGTNHHLAGLATTRRVPGNGSLAHDGSETFGSGNHHSRCEG